MSDVILPEVRTHIHFLGPVKEKLLGEGKKGRMRFTFFAGGFLCRVKHPGASLTGLMHCWLMIKLKEQKEIGRKAKVE